MRKTELENRIIQFSIKTIKISGLLNQSPAGQTLSKQVARSGTSLALNYAEAQAAESKKDFVHKMGITLKELRETDMNLKLISGANLIKNQELIQEILRESNELISIFVASIRTAKTRI